MQTYVRGNSRFFRFLNLAFILICRRTFRYIFDCLDSFIFCRFWFWCCCRASIKCSFLCWLYKKINSIYLLFYSISITKKCLIAVDDCHILDDPHSWGISQHGAGVEVGGPIHYCNLFRWHCYSININIDVYLDGDWQKKSRIGKCVNNFTFPSDRLCQISTLYQDLSFRGMDFLFLPYTEV